MKARRRVLIVLICLAFAALLAAVYFLFTVRGIYVQGAPGEEENVITLSGIRQNQSVFFINEQAVMDGVQTDPMLKPVGVQITYPDRITITVQQRVPAAYVRKEGVILVLDNECSVLRAVPDDSQPHYPMVDGLKFATFEVGQTLATHDQFQIDVLARVLQQAAQGELDIAGIDMAWPASIVLETKDGFLVELGDDTQLEEKFVLAAKSLATLEERGILGGVLNVSAADTAYYSEN